MLFRSEKALPDLSSRLLKFSTLNFEKTLERDGNKKSHKYPIPEGFNDAHAKYFNKEITMYEFSNMFHVSDTKIREWMKECNLPLRPRGTHKGLSSCITKPITVSTEPLVQQITPIEKYVLSFNLFGHKLTIRNPFKVEKINSIPALTTEDFDDFTEY